MVTSSTKRRPGVTTRGLMFAVLVSGLTFVLALSLIILIRNDRIMLNRITCYGCLHQLALGLAAYHNDHGCFPPPYIADVDGKPMHSWRTLILPYIDNKALYDAYNFNQPWDGPDNRRIADVRIACYRCPQFLGGP